MFVGMMRGFGGGTALATGERAAVGAAERGAVGAAEREVVGGAALREEQAANAANAAARRRADAEAERNAAQVAEAEGAGAGAAAAAAQVAQVAEAEAAAGAGAAAQAEVELVERRNPQVVVPAVDAERERLLQPVRPQIEPLQPPPQAVNQPIAVNPMQPIAELPRAAPAPAQAPAQADILGLRRGFPAEHQQLAAAKAQAVVDTSIARNKPVRAATQKEGKNATQKAVARKQVNNLDVDDAKQPAQPPRRKGGKNAKTAEQIQEEIQMEEIRAAARAQEERETNTLLPGSPNHPPHLGAFAQLKHYFSRNTGADYSRLHDLP